MVWIWLKDIYVLLGKIQKTCFLAKTTVILLYIHLRPMAGHYGFLRRPGSSFLVSNKFMSSYVICLLIAREIFLLHSDCSSITNVHSFSPLTLLSN